MFYKQLEKVVSELDCTSMMLLGDFNAVTNPEMDKITLQNKKEKKG